MPRFAIATALAASLTLSPMTAAPAAADDASDIAAVALGALVIYGLAQSNKKSSKKPSTQVKHQPAPKPKGPKHGFSGKSGQAYQSVRYGHSIVPLTCLRQPSGSGNNLVVSDKCLREAGYKGRLPGNCETWVNSSRGRNPAYGANCLAKHGYLIGGRK